MASQVASVRLAGGLEDSGLLEKALTFLDARILNALHTSSSPDLEALNRSLAALIAENSPVSQSFQVRRLAETPPVYALIANFGLAGPSAVRIYSTGTGGLSLAARIDRLTQQGFFDEYLDLVPIPARTVVFVTVTGRTDDLQTGFFAAWQFLGQKLEPLWSADLLQQSNYQVGSNGFLLTYCSQTDDRNPRQCRRMTRERFVWDKGAWRRVEQLPLSVPNR